MAGLFFVYSGERFWHQHADPNCPDGRIRKPKSNTGYWGPKLQRNVERDAENHARLEEMGWKVLAIWECQTADDIRTSKRIEGFLNA